MSKAKLRKKKGNPSWTFNGVVMGWRLSDTQDVPAIEQCRITVTQYPVAYYQHFNWGPEKMALREKGIVKLGWDNSSFDLQRPPVSVGEYSLLSGAIKRVASVLACSGMVIRRCYPSTIEFLPDERRQDYCILYFDHQAYEFYDLLFILGRDACPFENVPNPKLNTLKQLLNWAKSFEFKRRKMYKSEGFTWEPYSPPDAKQSKGD